MANPWQPIPEIKVADKTDPPRSVTVSVQKRPRPLAQTSKTQPLPIAKLIALAGCVSMLAALFLATLPDFQSEIVSLQTRVEIFTVRYTMPICFFQLGVFWILYYIRRR
jgi:hypothetical protein